MAESNTRSHEDSRIQLRLLAPRLENASDEELDQLGELVGHSAITIELMGRYLNHNPALSPPEYIVKLDKMLRTAEFTRTQNLYPKDSLETAPHQMNGLACLMLNWKALTGSLPNHLIRVCGYFAPYEPIPTELFIKTFRPNFWSRIRDRLFGRQTTSDALQQCFDLGLLTPIGNDPSISPYVKAFAMIQDRLLVHAGLRKLTPPLIELTLDAANSALPENINPWLPHLEGIAQNAELPDQQASLWNSIGLMRKVVADYDPAIAAYENGLEAAKSVDDPNYFLIALLLNNQGIIYHELKQSEDAQSRFEQAVSIADQRQLSNEHPIEYASFLKNLSSAKYQLREFEAAKALAERALAIHENHLGKDHPSVAHDLNGLGLILQDMAQLATAKTMFERALQIAQQSYGSNHPNIALYANNLGNVRLDEGQLDEAKSMFEWSLQVAKNIYGEHHPRVALYMNNLGLVLRRLGKLDEAKSLYEQAMLIDKDVYGIEHREMAEGAINMGILLCDSGDHQGAKAMLDWGLHIFNATVGERHEFCATAYTGLGHLLYKNQDYQAALEAYQKARDIDLDLFGANHLNIGMRYHNLGTAYEGMEDMLQAKIHYEQAIEIWEATLPKNHNDLKLAREGWARVTRQRGEW